MNRYGIVLNKEPKKKELNQKINNRVDGQKTVNYRGIRNITGITGAMW